MNRPNDKNTLGKPAKTEDEKLDEALEHTFPASDPPAMTDPSTRVGDGAPTKSDTAGGA
jgi:hypothetical protein